MNKEAKISPLTTTLKTVEQELEAIGSGIVNIFEEVRNSEQQIVADALETRNISSEQAEDAKSEVQELLERSVYKPLDEAKRLTYRFLTVTRKIQRISKKIEPWERVKGDLKKLIFESKRFKERFPAEYEKQRRLREVPWARETFRYLPKEEEGFPYEQLLRERRRRLEPVHQSKIQQLTKTGQIEDLQEKIQGLIVRLYTLIREYFGREGPIVTAADSTHRYIISLRKPGMLDFLNKIPGVGTLLGFGDQKQKREALDEISRILETIFGYAGQPGPYITTGEKAFLMPTLTELQEASSGLERLTVESLGRPSSALEELERVEKEYTQAQLRNRLGFQRRQRRRGVLLQRLVSLVTKEDFNG